MNFKEYEVKAKSTALYKPEVAVAYVTLGLSGETGEFIEKLMFSECETDLIRKEVGDILWYTAMIRQELNLDPIEWPILKENPDEEIIMKPFVCVGIVCENVKKWIRDDCNGNKAAFPEDRKKKIHAALIENLKALQYICFQAFGEECTLEKVAEENVQKLAERKSHNAIHGSGDNR